MKRLFSILLAGLLAGCSAPRLAETAEVSFVTGVPTRDGQTSVVVTSTPLNLVMPFIPPECEAPDAGELRAYEHHIGQFVVLRNGRFDVNGRHFPVYGANYYPRETPFGAFLTATSFEAVNEELDILIDAGINTLRIVLYHSALFACDGMSLVPIGESFRKFDGIIELAHERNLRLIVVLNGDIAPYENTTLSQEQMRFIMGRYRSEPSILAWDLRDSGDVDYENYGRGEVLAWLAETSALFSAETPQMLTAGWRDDSLATMPYVDFVSFQHYGEYLPLRENVAKMRAQATKPILLSAIGYSTHDLDETAQRNLLFQAFDEVRNNEMLGWVIYMAFDYPLTALCEDIVNCDEGARRESRYGIWNTSYFPKLSVDAVRLITGE